MLGVELAQIQGECSRMHGMLLKTKLSEAPGESQVN